MTNKELKESLEKLKNLAVAATESFEKLIEYSEQKEQSINKKVVKIGSKWTHESQRYILALVDAENEKAVISLIDIDGGNRWMRPLIVEFFNQNWENEVCMDEDVYNDMFRGFREIV